jgi:hypothetical protein
VARVAVVAAAAVLVLLVAAQLLLPDRVAEGIEERLTERGGRATVSVEATPAVRLLLGDGDRIEVRGSDLDLDVTEDTEVLARLDRFDEVDVLLERVAAGPFAVQSFDLRRHGGDAYVMRSSATTSGVELLRYGADRLGGLAGPALGLLSDEVPAQARREVPVELDVALRSSDGGIEVVSGSGTVAGIDTGPLAEIITAAIVSRL